MRTSSSFVLPRALAVLGAAAVVSAPAAAHAASGVTNIVSPGLTLSLSLGEKVAFGVGLDLRYTKLINGSYDSTYHGHREGMGVFAQATWLNFSYGRFAAGLHGGGDPGGFYLFSADGELGWSYRTALDDAHPGAHGVHVGVMGMLISIASLSIRGVIPWPGSNAGPDVNIGIGVRYPGPFGTLLGISGRPLHVGETCALPPVALRERGARRFDRLASLDEATRAALASAWIEDARAESASVPAFLALARDLAAAGAPSLLLQRSLAAAADERRHTALCSAIAGDFAGADVTPLSLAAPHRPAPDRGALLQRLAVESWKDGCLGEGAAAARARRQYAGARDRHARAALRVIARDEQRHAELGWQVLDFCLAEGGASVARALDEAMSAPPPSAGEDSASALDDTEWTAHGRLDAPAIDASTDEAWSRARERGAARLDAFAHA